MFRTLPLFKSASSNVRIAGTIYLKPDKAPVHDVVVTSVIDKGPYINDSIVYDYAQTSPSLHDNKSSYSTLKTN